MKKTKLNIAIAIACSSIATLGYCASPPMLELTKVKKNNHIELLFFQQSDTGSLQAIAKTAGCYNLTLTDMHRRIIYFSDTPNKITGKIEVDKYLENLTHSESADKIKPNGVMHALAVGDNNQVTEVSIVGTLSNPRYDNKQFSYTFCGFGDNKSLKNGELREVNLFVDPIHRWPP